jgi:Tfp pilus assembly protein FimT
MLSELKNSKAFTLMDLIIAIGLISILSAVAAPSFMKQLSQQKVKSAARDLCSTFQAVKLQAVQENDDIIIKFSPATYTPNGGVGGYTIFRDDGSGGGTAGNLTQDGTEPTLRTVTMPSDVSLISASFTGSVAGYNGQGLSANALSGNVVLRSSKIWYRVNLSAAGNITLNVSGDGTNWSGSL